MLLYPDEQRCSENEGKARESHACSSPTCTLFIRKHALHPRSRSSSACMFFTHVHVLHPRARSSSMKRSPVKSRQCVSCVSVTLNSRCDQLNGGWGHQAKIVCQCLAHGKFHIGLDT